MKTQTKTTKKNNSYLMKITDLSFRYERKKPLLKEICLSVREGEIIGISGENGSGKSTLLKLLVGLLKPKSGEIMVHGRIGYSPQNLLLFENLTVLENFLVFGKGMKLREEDIRRQAKEIMDRLKFREYENTLVKNLSGGTAQKTNFGISLLGEPDILILDEPYQGMDYASFTAFWDIQFEMRKKGKAIIIVSHLIEDKEKFTKALHLVDGYLRGCEGEDCPTCCGQGEDVC